MINGSDAREQRTAKPPTSSAQHRRVRRVHRRDTQQATDSLPDGMSQYFGF